MSCLGEDKSVNNYELYAEHRTGHDGGFQW